MLENCRLQELLEHLEETLMVLHLNFQRDLA